MIKCEYGSNMIRCGCVRNERLEAMIEAGKLKDTYGRVTHTVPIRVDLKKIDTPAPAWCPLR